MTASCLFLAFEQAFKRRLIYPVVSLCKSQEAGVSKIENPRNFVRTPSIPNWGVEKFPSKFIIQKKRFRHNSKKVSGIIQKKSGFGYDSKKGFRHNSKKKVSSTVQKRFQVEFKHLYNSKKGFRYNSNKCIIQKKVSGIIRTRFQV